MAPLTNQKTYDLVPYVKTAFPQSHPDRLATVATLFGLTPPAIDRCRVLELGCARGGNLIPMALGLPGSQFVGIDHSPRQIADGQRVIAGINLKNIELRTVNILDIDASYGLFDYIVSHGVYSWVPAPVRDKLVDVYRRHLAPHGVGYISYNALPGWHMRGMVRDMMLYHSARYLDEPPPTQIGHARALLEFLAQAVPADKNPYGLLLRQELDVLRKTADASVYHDLLEIDNDAFYFSQFERHLKAHDLRFLGEAKFSDMRAFDFPPGIRQVLATLAPSQVDMEQYLDFLRNRTFRQSLVCHERQQPVFTVPPERIAHFHLASSYQPVAAQPDVAGTGAVEFIGRKGEKVATAKPMVKAAMCCLADAWPQALSFDALVAQARARLGAGGAIGAGPDDALALGGALLTAYASNSSSGGMVELRVRPLPLVTTISARPTVSPLARWQALHEPGQQHVINMRHERVDIAGLVVKLLPLLDGTRDRDTLLNELAGGADQTHVGPAGEGATASTPRAMSSKELEQLLRWIASVGLFIA